MKKAIITDFSGTLANDTFPEAIAQYEQILGMDKGQIMRVITGKYWPQFSLDQISEDDFWYGSLRDAGVDPVRVEDISELRNYILYNTELCIVPLIDFFRNLRSNGIKTGIITNASRPWFEFWKKAFSQEFSDGFDDIVTSYETKIRKPNPGIYLEALSRLGAKPVESVYIDNEMNDVKGAMAVGIGGVLFKDPYQVIGDTETKLWGKERPREGGLIIYKSSREVEP